MNACVGALGGVAKIKRSVLRWGKTDQSSTHGLLLHIGQAHV